MNLPLVLDSLRPGEAWSLDGEEYSGLTWLDDTEPPTEEECIAEWNSLESLMALDAIRSARQDAYRQMSDPIFFKWQRGEATEQDWLDSVAEVRRLHPYTQNQE